MENESSHDSERRRCRRSPVAVELKLHAPDLHFVLLSRTVDMSSNGAFVRSSRPLPVGAAVTVQLERGEAKHPLTLEAKVIRIGTSQEGRSGGIGLSFANLTHLDEALLDEIIQHAGR